MALARWFRIRAVCDEQPNSRDAQVGDLVRQVHLLRQILPNFRQQLARAVGFRHIVVTAGRASSFFLAAERIGGDRDDRDRFQGGIGFDVARGGIAVHDWQLNIHQDEIGPLSRDTEALVSQSCAL